MKKKSLLLPLLLSTAVLGQVASADEVNLNFDSLLLFTVSPR